MITELLEKVLDFFDTYGILVAIGLFLLAMGGIWFAKKDGGSLKDKTYSRGQSVGWLAFALSLIGMTVQTVIHVFLVYAQASVLSLMAFMSPWVGIDEAAVLEAGMSLRRTFVVFAILLTGFVGSLVLGWYLGKRAQKKRMKQLFPN